MLTAGLVALAPAAAAAPTQLTERTEQAKRQYHIAPQPLVSALNEFGRQSGRDILFSTEVVGKKQSPGVRGAKTPEEALRALLAGTGLAFHATNDRTFLVQVADAVPSGTASTQTESATDEGAQANGNTPSDDSKVEKVTVTGTRIRGVRPVGSPVTTYDREDLDKSGVATIDQFARRMPQNLSSVDASSPGFANTGSGFDQSGSNSNRGAGFNLRGLGPSATLTLVDGHRVAAAGDGAFVDISLIPLSAVERIEVLGDGASAIYGADAVAGVVNIILRKAFEGAETSLRYGGAPEGGAGEFTFSQLLGTKWSDGNAMIAYEHDHQEGLSSTQRDFIPAQPGPALVLPKQDRDSAFLAGHQDLPLGFQLSGIGYLSSREYSSLSFANGIFEINQQGTSNVSGVGATIGRTLGGDWRGDLSFDFSELDQQAEFSQPAFDLTGTGNTTTSTTDVALRFDGTLLSISGGNVRLALGTAYRSDTYEAEQTTTSFGFTSSTASGDLSRTVKSLFGELFVPLVGGENTLPFADRLWFSAALRHDHYSDFGSTTNPKLGVLWSPIESLAFRASYGTSFRTPLLKQLASSPSFVTLDLPNSASPTGVTDTLIDGNSGNPDLGPERSTSWVLGADFQPFDDVSVSASYFSVDFSNRIAPPPLPGGSLFDLYSNAAALAPFIDLTPDPAAVLLAFATPGFFDFAGHGPAGVEAIFDARPQNIAVSTQSGIELTAAYGFASSAGDFDLSASGIYFLENDYQSAAGAPSLSLLGRLGEPVKFRGQAGLGWQLDGFGAVVTVNYKTSYENNLFSPAVKVDSWTTADLQLSYQTEGEPQASHLLGGLVLRLTVHNLFDQDPPSVTVPSGSFLVDIGYDPANASPEGRVVSFQLTKKW